MANIGRIKKVSEQIKRELPSIFSEVVFSEKINFVSITSIELSRDFKFADVYITIINSSEDGRKELIGILTDNAGKIRSILAKKMTTRTVPALKFIYDNAIEYGARMDKLLTSLTKDIKEDDTDT